MIQLPPELLRAICDRPFDDNLRLVAADWWEEHGETERAEFVRLGIELATINSHGGHAPGTCKDCDRFRFARNREYGIGSLSNCHKWAHGFPLFGLDNWEWEWRRGWVDEVHCRLADWSGEVCSECEGRKYDTGTNDDGSYYPRECGWCDGKGRLGGHGPAIVACQPVTRLVLVDVGDSGPTKRETGRRWLNWARQQAGLTPLEPRAVSSEPIRAPA